MMKDAKEQINRHLILKCNNGEIIYKVINGLLAATAKTLV
jgi:hypothetical protein